MRSLAVLWVLLVVPWARAGDADTFFEINIRPVLAGSCFKCHGGKKTSHGLRVDSREALLKGGESGPALIPGEPAKSLLIQAIQYTHDDLKMPPDKPLSTKVVADFSAWVKEGVHWPKKQGEFAANAPQEQRHWAFEPVRKVAPPAAAAGWSETAIDRFIAAKLSAQGLRSGHEADRRTLIRRVTFDLIGLPPSPEEVAAFLADDSPSAWEKVVDRLLASPAYGERWGRHWMDVVRYADTAGDNADYPIPEVRLNRDYIIDSFNADKPYEQFVQEQIAGDILAKQGARDRYAERVVATGFLALSRRYATGPYELWNLTMEDTIETTGRALLGLTLRCARCHDHKFDPVTKEDYYALYGIFASTEFPWTGAEEFASMQKPREHMVPLLPPAEASARLTAYQSALNQAAALIQRTEKEDPLAKRLAELDQQLQAKKKQGKVPKSSKQEADALKVQIAVLEKERDKVNSQLQAKIKSMRERQHRLQPSNLPADLPAAYAVQEGTPVDMYVHLHGDVDQHGPIVKRGMPQFLALGKAPSIPANSSGRLQLAQWLTSAENPLTARVMVNRIWQYHFGKGIVTTPSNFGVRGEAPTHPELLDWLAGQFVAGGWSMKTLHRQILLSKTYRLASDNDEDSAAKDPGNRWYWRFDRLRLDAEEIRDSLLLAAGKLDRSRPGAHPFPSIDHWKWTQHSPFKDVYPSNHRSVYLMTQRFQRHPYLALFDGPDTNTTTEQRTHSTVPQQALFLMNDPFILEQATGLARRLIGSGGDPWRRIELAHQIALARPARHIEMEMAVHYLDAYRKQLEKDGVEADRLELEAWTSYARMLLCSNEFVYID